MDRLHPHSFRQDPDKPQVDGAPQQCRTCGAQLCLRKQVINLALGNDEEMYCLQCLAEQNDQTASEILSSIMEYIDSRECFRKEWQRYKSVDFCPDFAGCLPSVCFPQKKR